MSGTRKETEVSGNPLHSAVLDIPDASRYLLALSGGLDSSALLLMLAHYLPGFKTRVQAIHVHHGLSPHADAWQRHCEVMCQRLGIPLIVEKVSVRSEGEGLEAAARKRRYAAFEKHVQEDALLLLAHHANDQAETVLMRCLKSLDVRTLAGIPCQRRFGAGRLFRPLLNRSRAEIEAWARAQNLNWVEDESNRSPDFDRNRVRHQILARQQALVPRLLNLSSRAQRFVALERRLAALALSHCKQKRFANEEVLYLPAVLKYGPDLQERILRQWLVEHDLPQAPAWLMPRFSEELASAGSESLPVLNWGSISLRRYQDFLYLINESHAREDDLESADWEEILCEPEDLPLVLKWAGRELRINLLKPTDTFRQSHAPGSSFVCLDAQAKQFHIRTRRAGDKIDLEGRAPQSLKKYWSDAGMPPWLRASLPLILVDEKLVWAGWAVNPSANVQGDVSCILQIIYA